MAANAERLLAAYEAWNRDDLEGFLELMDPDVVLDLPGIFPGFEPAYRGHDGIERFWRHLRDPWERFEIDVEGVVEHDDEFVVAMRFRAKGVGSGADVDMSYGHGVRMRDGRAVEIYARGTPEEARRALRASSRTASS
jgi:ketosteroid isomerase-like protein